MLTNDVLNMFFNDKYRVLELIEQKEEYKDGSVFAKTSQEELGEELQISKHKINDYIRELIAAGLIDTVDQKGKYCLTDHGRSILDCLNEGRRRAKVSSYKCISLFAGVGGIDLGFKNAGFETVYANEFDPKAVHTYEQNSELKVDCRDIHEVVNELQQGIDPFGGKSFNILLAGFPCQAFSIAGYREGFDDKKGRGGLFFEIMKIIRIKSPEIVFLENVKNLQGHDKGKTYRIIKEALESEGYIVKEKVLNSMEYGNVPQNRERIYIVAFKDIEKAKRFKFPFPIELTNKIDDVVDFNLKAESRFYYGENFPHIDVLLKEMKRQDTVYQWRRVYVRENKNNVCPTLTANMGTGGHNVPLILSNNGIRKLTPYECFQLQGFPKDFKLPNDISMSYLYKQAGNSVSVSVIERIAKEIVKVL